MIHIDQKLKFAITSPTPTVNHPSAVTTASTEELTHKTKDEDRQLQNFLDKDLSKFDRVQDPMRQT